tara:strand:- start:4818 stop:5036 length:219 start_codon:yes stop_codon:yes gene_type:complete
MKLLNLPSEPSHIINYVDTETFHFFILWVVEKMRMDEECEGYEEEDITNKVIDIMFYAHKHNKLFQVYMEQR